MMKKEHKEALELLRKAYDVISELIQNDDEFNELVLALEEKSKMFPYSIDEMEAEVMHFINEHDYDKQIINGVLVFNGTQIDDIFSSECLRFKVDPAEYYHLTKKEIAYLSPEEEEKAPLKLGKDFIEVPIERIERP